MTVEQAIAVNALLRALLGVDDPTSGPLERHAVLLAKHAHRKLLAGLDEARVHDGFDSARRARAAGTHPPRAEILRELRDYRSTVDQIRRALALAEGATTEEIAAAVEDTAEQLLIARRALAERGG